MFAGVGRLQRGAWFALGLLALGCVPSVQAAGQEYRVPPSPPPGSVRLDSLDFVFWAAFGTPPCPACPVRACTDAPIEFDLFGSYEAHDQPLDFRLEPVPGGVPLMVLEFERTNAGAPDAYVPIWYGLQLPAAPVGRHFVDIETREFLPGSPPPPPVVHRQRVGYDVVATCQVALRPAMPNPFSGRTTLSINLFREIELEVSVHDLAGRRVATLARGRFGPGETFFEWDGAGAADGVYLVRFNVDGQLQSSRVTLLRNGR
jgi:hypothetical protein